MFPVTRTSYVIKDVITNNNGRVRTPAKPATFLATQQHFLPQANASVQMFRDAVAPSAAVNRLIRRRPFYIIDYQDLDRSFCHLQLQTKLVFQCLYKRRCQPAIASSALYPLLDPGCRVPQ